jgi:protein-disulfide isomerase
MTADNHDETGTPASHPPVDSGAQAAVPAQGTALPQIAGTPAGSGYPAVPAPGNGYVGAPVAPRTNTMSIVSLITGFFCSIAAVITGHLALGQIRRTGEAGKGLAITGLVLGYLGLVAGTLALIFAVLFAASIGAFFSTIVGSTSSSPSIVASGQAGAANLDEGYLEVGAGRVVVDLYIDPMCPFCGQFDRANGDTLAALVDDDSITLRLHPLTFLDGASQGTAYSSRASAALTCEAALNPESTLDYLAAMFAKQPAEGTAGLTDDQLVNLSSGSESIADCVAGGEYQAWAQWNTENAITGPIEGAEITSIQGTPTVLVDGSQYTGPIDDPLALVDFISGPVA